MSSLTSYYSKSSFLTSFSPICSHSVPEQIINQHLDSNCQNTTPAPPSSSHSQLPLHPLFVSSKKSHRNPSPSSPSPPPITKPTPDLKSKKRARAPAPTSDASHSKKLKVSASKAALPLSERLRPRTLDEFVGQPHLTTHGSPLLNLLASGSAASFIFWGPPGYVPSFHSTI